MTKAITEITPSPQDTQAALAASLALERLFQDAQNGEVEIHLRTHNDSDATVVLPVSVVLLLSTILHEVAVGHSVSIVPSCQLAC